jgi:spermidine synthase
VRKPVEDSETVYISERYGVRSLHIGSDTIQSSMRLARPIDPELAYTRSMMAFLLFVPPPRDVLMIGVGGGSLAKFIYHKMPAARIKAVEVNPQVVAIARQYFDVPPDDDRFQIVIADGSTHIEDERLRPQLIIVDGYDADAHAEELASSAFYQSCRARLAPRGMFVVNLWGGDKDFNVLRERLRSAFPDGTLCLPAERPGNVIVLGFERNTGPYAWSELAARADALAAEYGLEFPRFVEALRKMNRHDSQSLYVRE